MPSIPNLALRGLEVRTHLTLPYLPTPPTSYILHPPSIPSHEGLTPGQIFFAILILGLSGHLVASQVYGGAPSSTNYNVFLGIWLLVVSFVGVAAGFVSALQGVVMVGLDALSVLFAFAGGVVGLFFLLFLDFDPF